MHYIINPSMSALASGQIEFAIMERSKGWRAWSKRRVGPYRRSMSEAQADVRKMMEGPTWEDLAQIAASIGRPLDSLISEVANEIRARTAGRSAPRAQESAPQV